MTRLFWLSFADPRLPPGAQFLGVALVEVTEADAAAAKARVDEEFPDHLPGAEWITAATLNAAAWGCNPGGSVAAIDLTTHQAATRIPRHQLLSADDLQRLDLIDRPSS